MKAEAAAPAAEKPVDIKPTDPVITVKAPCGEPEKKETCDTVVTKEQFERLSEALQPNMSAPIKIRLANAYARLAALSKEAEKRGLDKTPKFEENMRFARMQILSQQLTAALQEDAYKVSDEDIEKYYKEKTDTYQEASLLRLYLPANKQPVTPKPPITKASAQMGAAAGKKEAEEKAEEAGKAAMKKTADSLRARAAKGENFDTLEKEAYLAAGLKGTPPSTKMDKVRPNTLPPAHKAALDLKPGEVSPVISDASGHYIYKMVGRHTLPLDSVRPEIKNWVATQRFRDAMQEYQGKSELNNAYFGITPKPTPPPAKPGEPKEEEESVEPD